MAGSEQLTFDNDIITINNENQEEAEELKDRKRREEEIHNLLSHAMDDFNFDYQSTIYTSMDSDEGNNINLEDQQSFTDQYREADNNEQLKVLYEVRVREVTSLNEQVEKLKLELDEQQQMLKKKITLLEIENERKNISLKEGQGLLVEKTEQIQQLEVQLESTKKTVHNLESKVGQLNEEIVFLRELNLQLEQQVTIMDRDFLLHNKSTDKEFQELQRTKVAQLEAALNKATELAEHKDHQYKELIAELKDNLQEHKNSLAQKDLFIDKLRENFEQTLNQCHDLQKTVEELRKNPDRVGSPLEEELRKIREYNERTDTLCENVRKAVAVEFQERIGILSSENQKLKETFDAQQKQLKEAHQHLQIFSTFENEKEVLHSKLKEIEKQLEKSTTEQDILRQKLSHSEMERDLLNDRNEQLLSDHALFENVKKENQNLQQKIIDLESYIPKLQSSLTLEKSIQAVLPLADSKLLELQDELVSAHDQVGSLKNTVTLLQQENSQLQIKVGLEQERETLIKSLQEKAAEFEKIIFEKQTRSKTVSVETNTETYQDENSLLKVKYEALLYQAEAKLRKDLKREFNEKLEKIFIEFNQKLESQTCKECSALKEENQKLNELREQDRDAVIKLMDAWEQKFFEIEKETESKITNLLTSQMKNDQELLSHATLLEQNYKEKYKKLNDHFEQKADLKIQQHKEKLTQSNVVLYGTLSNKLNRIRAALGQGDDEIFAVERRFIKEKIGLEQK